ncbi:hypothetical protein Kpol_483p21 [Vanderwaltozyma polyspora DSM 70294]|uniref:tRNA-dihydrouridine(47) synthase [NAD(P)(+)] n=1 Tax=Vanderwaltozyma polyspora (strain ATCC 22028 / DSM 70294 / BCRC 21397 / CBS 2163 / NBRC 10782 / NRRL Y-8283 / UCD 57-17) TaxID=436907 RepID=DUS3_VANPO|nr:uncharacterized protein Kpol_483p21 [Vanderwaltozyma polyspora DSM 70294]A7TQ73.1 RecName: Full=tRNA-dihydrouridine(47) synthase [NAD(P)(+)]; AltName: Full=mRNA-dihydrouridine synthase DUS3; AltName: Full=tRNA-dihydrouridine synthase 3 [Vanderwaltozyma polyspora DSM 70294]EDO15602.1 hypothetical protein Kpol_483p21 [Vanderwaltozyma polyspora DSM 70294]
MSAEKRELEDSGSNGELKRQDVSFSKGIAHIKAEFIAKSNDNSQFQQAYNDEEIADADRIGAEGGKNSRKHKKKQRGQNKSRDNRQVKEEKVLCPKYIQGYSEDGESLCQFGDKCRFVHDIKEYLSHKKPEIELDQFKICPVFDALGFCPMGFKCRFMSSHFDKENFKLVKRGTDEERQKLWSLDHEVNRITSEEKLSLIKRRFPFTKSNEVLDIIDSIQQEFRDITAPKVSKEEASEDKPKDSNEAEVAPQVLQREEELKKKREHQRELYLKYKDTRYFAQEKKDLDLRRKKIVSPLTTVGNLPYRRLMRKLGADVTYSEMALAVPLIQGTNSEWALPKAHSTEIPGFGVQIACSKAWQAAKAAEALAKFTPDINEINLNSGCPIDLLYRQGSGSALLDNPARMIRCLNAMNYVSDSIPITVKIRTGTRDSHPVADTLVKRLVYETDVAAITLHGRSRQQRYTRVADWDYVSTVAKSLRESEASFLESAEGKESRESKRRIQFVGNGDVNNFEDWHRILNNDENIDSIMVARGALIKPWVFEEVDAQQHLDKSSTERLEILRDYAQFSMEHWGTDEYGIAQCRRFFCEFMSFFHRYIPIGICERYPVQLNERPPNWVGRDDLETLMGSTDARDWIKLSEMFFGKVEESFVFTPKHKSSSFPSA